MQRIIVLALAALAVLAVWQFRALRMMKAEIAQLQAAGAEGAAAFALHELNDRRRDETVRTVDWLHAYASSAEGLQRRAGLCPGGRPDSAAIGYWLVDVYTRERLRGASEPEARQRVVQRIRQSGEWRRLHGEAP